MFGSQNPCGISHRQGAQTPPRHEPRYIGNRGGKTATVLVTVSTCDTIFVTKGDDK